MFRRRRSEQRPRPRGSREAKGLAQNVGITTLRVTYQKAHARPGLAHNSSPKITEPTTPSFEPGRIFARHSAGEGSKNAVFHGIFWDECLPSVWPGEWWCGALPSWAFITIIDVGEYGQEPRG